MDDEWDLGPDGHVRLIPLTSWQAAISTDDRIGLRLKYAANKAAFLAGDIQSVQVLILPDMAQELARDLLKVAAEASTPTG